MELKKYHNTWLLARAGLGSLERNYFILSSWRGQKQLFGNNTSGQPAITIAGFSMEGKWALNRNSWLKAEVAQSISPVYIMVQTGLPANSVCAIRTARPLRFNCIPIFPLPVLRVERFYKKTGANYQSFNSYQKQYRTAKLVCKRRTKPVQQKITDIRCFTK